MKNITKIDSRLRGNDGKQGGQIALIMLLVTAVALTLGLSASRRVVTETKINTDEESLKQAFNTAESGIDYYLGTGSTQYLASDSNSKAFITVNEIVGTGNTLVSTTSVPQNKRINFWLVAHDSNGNISYTDPTNYNGGVFYVCVENAFNGSIGVDYFFSETAGSLGMVGVGRTGVNMGGSIISGFPSITPANNSCVTGYKRVATFSRPGVYTDATPLLVSATPYFGSTRVLLQVSSGDSIPTQGKEIVSKGVVGDENTGVRRTVRVMDTYDFPDVFFDGLTSNGGAITSE